MITYESFGEQAMLYRLTNTAGIQVTVTDFGARIVGIGLPVEQGGGLRAVSLAATSAEHYQQTDTYPGATILPVAGRISGAKAVIAGQTYQFTENEPGRTLHGGSNTANEQYWQTEIREEDNQLVCHLVLPDGLNGFPGPVTVSASYTLTEKNELLVDYQATTESDTLFNPTNHVYFNLSGDFTQAVDKHKVRIAAEDYLPLGADNLPLGHKESVAGSPFDFREPTYFEQGFVSDHPQNLLVKGYDHPWLVDNSGVVMEVTSPDERVRLRVKTDQDAVVVYTYNFPNEELATFHGAFSAECQAVPNACNLEGFGSIVLEKGQTYRSHTSYQFDWQD